MEDRLLTLKNIVDVVGLVISELEPTELEIVLGMVVDEYGARHGLNEEETLKILDTAAEAQKRIFGELGAVDYV